LKLLFGDWNNVKARLVWRLRRHLSDGAFIKSDVKPLWASARMIRIGDPPNVRSLNAI
jgi:hypothetical protein